MNVDETLTDADGNTIRLWNDLSIGIMDAEIEWKLYSVTLTLQGETNEETQRLFELLRQTHVTGVEIDNRK